MMIPAAHCKPPCRHTLILAASFAAKHDVISYHGSKMDVKRCLGKPQLLEQQRPALPPLTQKSARSSLGSCATQPARLLRVRAVPGTDTPGRTVIDTHGMFT